MGIFTLAWQLQGRANVYEMRTLSKMFKSIAMERSQVILVGGLVAALLAMLLLMLAYVPV